MVEFYVEMDMEFVKNVLACSIKPANSCQYISKKTKINYDILKFSHAKYPSAIINLEGFDYLVRYSF